MVALWGRQGTSTAASGGQGDAKGSPQTLLGALWDTLGRPRANLRQPGAALGRPWGGLGRLSRKRGRPIRSDTFSGSKTDRILEPPGSKFQSFSLQISVSNFVFFLMPFWRPSWTQKPAKGRPRGAKGQAKSSLEGPGRLHLQASKAKARPLENTGRADTNAGSGHPRPVKATP